jgi:ribosomal protein S27E
MTSKLLCPGTGCGAEVAEPHELCATCWNFRAELLARIQVNWPRVHGLLIPAQRRGADERVTGGAGSASRPPLNVTVYAAIEASLDVLLSWANTIRQATQENPLPWSSWTARSPWLFVHAIAALIDGDESLSGPDKVRYYTDLYRIDRSLRVISRDSVRESEHVDIACPQCGRMTIISRNHGDAVTCLTCNAAWGQAAWYAQLNP